MRRHRKKRRKSQNTDSAPNMHNDKDELLKQTILDFNDEEMRKHKKKHKHEKLTVWEGLILLLLLIENGILEELVKTDEYEESDENEYEESNENEYEEFDENEYEEFGISKHSFNKNIEETKDPDIKEHDKKSHFDFEYFAED